MEVDAEKLRKIKDGAEIFYRGVGEVRCPYLDDVVAFNAKGLDHVKMKEWNKARTTLDQYIRLRLLRLAPEVLKQSHTLQEYFETRRFERRKQGMQSDTRWTQVLVLVRYYGFVAIINKCRVKVIVKEVDGGRKFFWSIIPFWKNRRAGDGTTTKQLHEGDMELQ